jgi:hypothetical protein
MTSLHAGIQLPSFKIHESNAGLRPRTVGDDTVKANSALTVPPGNFGELMHDRLDSGIALDPG